MDELDEAELRHEAREMYKDLGAVGCLECINEGIVFFSILLGIVYEETHGKKD